jgi:enoyl-CoA hydratase/carnithine racemase
VSEWKYTLYEAADHVARITINRPEVRNALHAGATEELGRHLDEIERNDDIWVAVITGAGEQAFSAGMDLKAASRQAAAAPQAAAAAAPAQPADRTAQPADRSAQPADHRDRSPSLTRRFHFAKPVIARVNGYALGGGLELAMACDIIVAADHAELGLPEPRRGLIAGGVGVHRLPRQIPLKVAMGYMLTGRHMSAQRAYELGLVNQVVPLAQLDAAVSEWIADILRCSPLAVRATKESAMRGLDLPLPQAASSIWEWEKRRRTSHDRLEGPRAFAEKRPPKWEGR